MGKPVAIHALLVASDPPANGVRAPFGGRCRGTPGRVSPLARLGAPLGRGEEMSVVLVGVPGQVEQVVEGVDEYPVDLENVGRDSGLARWAVRVHQRQEWPHGLMCRNDRQVWPCRLYRWGHRVLVAAGWSQADIDAWATGDG